MELCGRSMRNDAPKSVPMPANVFVCDNAFVSSEQAGVLLSEIRCLPGSAWETEADGLDWGAQYSWCVVRLGQGSSHSAGEI
jgi:hypothetical protein